MCTCIDFSPETSSPVRNGSPFPAGPSGHRGTSLASYNSFASVAQHMLSNTCHTSDGLEQTKKRKMDVISSSSPFSFC